MLLRPIFLSRELTLLVEGKLAKQDAVRQQSTARRSAEDVRVPVRGTAVEDAGFSRPANDNPTLDRLPACLPVTDEEVRLLHRHLGAQILGLFA